MTFYIFDDYGWYSGSSATKVARSTEVKPSNTSTTTVAGEKRANYTGYVWVDIPYVVPVVVPVVEPETPYKWKLDVGAFFDRFGTAKIAILSSQDSTVQAIVRDCLTRHWIDLKQDTTKEGLLALVSLGLITSSVSDNILSTPASNYENSALRKLFYGEEI